MRIETIEAANWRSWETVRIEEGTDWNLICGANGSGKTSILETIWALHKQRTARGNPLRHLVRRGYSEESSWARIQFSRTGIEHLATIQLSQPTHYTVDGDEIKPGDLSWMAPVVLIQPSDVGLITGSPTARRELMQRLAFQHDPQFLVLFRQFQRALDQRNHILKSDRFRSNEMNSWNHVFLAAATNVELRIFKIWQQFAPTCRQILTELFPGIIIELELQLSLLAQCTDLQEGSNGESENGTEVPQAWLELAEKALAESRNREASAGHTLVGPHRMDFTIQFDGGSARDVGSQGQIRSAVIAMRLAMIQLIGGSGAIKPVVLVDDMAGEVDDSRSTGLLKFLQLNGVQVWLTITDLRHFPPFIHDLPFTGWRVSDNTVKKF